MLWLHMTDAGHAQGWSVLTLKALLSIVCWSSGGRAARVKMMSRLSASKPAAAVPCLRPSVLTTPADTTLDHSSDEHRCAHKDCRSAGLCVLLRFCVPSHG